MDASPIGLAVLIAAWAAVSASDWIIPRLPASTRVILGDIDLTDPECVAALDLAYERGPSLTLYSPRSRQGS
ncbi:hypothetical protein [Halobaculum magnesiiphilum]|uniref:Uncharacterized protein n=1 Tax=Halobaculum magnesiiphilum TaxID=1017351 RepID=A0A8T8WB76_9EURY|nr:hypothetical protein [Halobaculum magnesiiphilum]QZP37087.1 hypothetical protein K6T50_12415 [Halobaculum magnesiiphilum]